MSLFDGTGYVVSPPVGVNVWMSTWKMRVPDVEARDYLAKHPPGRNHRLVEARWDDFVHLSPRAGRGRIIALAMIRVRGRFHLREADENRTKRARRLRKATTDAEAALWHRLRSRRLNGFKFVRQEPIGPHTVDFICREFRLIIEVDGGQHADNPRDAVRDQWLIDHNYGVLRFWNNDVLGNIAGVLETIAAALAEAPPHPDR